MRTDRFNAATVLLLQALTGMPAERLGAIRLVPRSRNLLRMPWYPDRTGGAFVHGDRIYITDTLHAAPASGDPSAMLRWLLLMTHEVGHVAQAWRVGGERASRWRFTAWAAAGYAVSFLRNGRHGYRKAALEVEADSARQRCRTWMERTGGCNAQHPLIRLVMRDDVAGMAAWLHAHADQRP